MLNSELQISPCLYYMLASELQILLCLYYNASLWPQILLCLYYNASLWPQILLCLYYMLASELQILLCLYYNASLWAPDLTVPLLYASLWAPDLTVPLLYASLWAPDPSTPIDTISWHDTRDVTEEATVDTTRTPTDTHHTVSSDLQWDGLCVCLGRRPTLYGGHQSPQCGPIPYTLDTHNTSLTKAAKFNILSIRLSMN